MDYIGNVIRKLRIQNGLTQTQLAEGICSTKQLLRIEKNKSNPTSYLLSLISERLKNELYEYLPYTTDYNAFELKNELTLAQDYYDKHQFSQTLELLLTSDVLNSTENEVVNMEIAILMGALANHVKIPFTVDEDYFIFLLRKRRVFSTLNDLFKYSLHQQEYKILNSLIVIYLEEEEFDKAEILLINCIKNYDANYAKITDSSYLRIIYNLSRLYFKLNKYQDAAEYSLKGLNHCIQNNSLIFFSDLCNIYGRSRYKLGDSDNSKEFIRSYIFFNKLLKPSSNYDSINLTLIERYNL